MNKLSYPVSDWVISHEAANSSVIDVMLCDDQENALSGRDAVSHCRKIHAMPVWQGSIYNVDTASVGQ